MYKIIQANSIPALESLVNTLLLNGYMITGSLTTEAGYFYQTVIKWDPDPVVKVAAESKPLPKPETKPNTLKYTFDSSPKKRS